MAVRRSHWLTVVLLGLALGSFALFYDETATGSQVARAYPKLNQGSFDPEPITPIPQEVSLDARKAALGKKLFHEPRLSSDNTISCAHCHNLANGGMDGLPRSIGIGGKEGIINAPTVFNSRFNASQFWDGRAATLEEQVDFPMMHTCEMASTWSDVIGKLERDEAYRRDFTAIYPGGVSQYAVRNAIAEFERSLITPDSRFDQFLRGDRHALDGEEQAGYALFKSLGCISCHQGVNIGGNMYEKIGLFGDYFADRGNVQTVDYGRYNVTGNEDHRHEFRVPPLRNVALTAPYFHDASAATLEQAVAVMGKYQLGVNLSQEEIARIVKFLGTLTGRYRPEMQE